MFWQLNFIRLIFLGGMILRSELTIRSFVTVFVRAPDKPGLGIDSLNEELIKEHMHEKYPIAWGDTSEWDNEWANDREWS